MGDTFDGIDLEDLAGSESPIMDESKLAAPPEPTDTTEPGREKDEDLRIDPEAVDIDRLAGLEAIDQEPKENDNEEEVNEEEELDESTKASQAPASQDKGSSPSSQDDMFTSLASALVEAGAFSSLAEEDIEAITDVDSLLNAVGKQTQEGRYADLNENQKKYLKALESGVPQETFHERTANAEQYKTLNDEKIRTAPALQKELIRRSFLIKGFDDAKATKYADLAIKDGTGAEDAVNAKASLISYEEDLIQDKINEADAERAATVEAEKTALATLKSKINESSEILPGIKVNSQTKTKVYDSMTKPVTTAGESPRNEVMEAYASDEDYKVKMHAIHILTKGLTDFSKLTKASKSKAVADLKAKLAETGSGKTGFPAPNLGNEVGTGLTSQTIAEELKSLKLRK